ncbi:type II secretion system protein GspM [Pseudomonas reactans]|uniref:type II secretion system protein GspM n=1 Tax=Pseudomonas reactans TaxID=117680 RepID=UPI0015A29C0A|nr:type II secretion system protein GspM [Pseudomonas reactans]NWA64574.1 type II secretion system protein M [Pseudomonas reactans]
MKHLQAWKALSARDRVLLKGLAVFLLTVLALQALWLPSRQRMDDAQQGYQQQRLLAQQVQQARPLRAVSVASRPSASAINESAEAAGLDVQQIEVQGEQLRLTISGEAQALLAWLVQMERDAGAFQMLILEKRERRLEARLAF